MAIRQPLVITAALLVAWSTSPPAPAGMNIEQLLDEPAPLSEEERESRREQIAREMQAAREREQAEAAARDLQHKATLDRESLRSAGERLIERRCQGCHTPETFERDNLTPLGWRLTLWRMEWWHGVALEPGEHRQLHETLVERSPASRGRALSEVALIISLPLLLVLLTVWRRRRPHS